MNDELLSSIKQQFGIDIDGEAELSFGKPREYYCGEQFRPYLDSADCCTDEECEIKKEADMYNVEPRIIKNSKQLFSELHYNNRWPLSAASDEASDYLFEQSPRDLE
jgi:hypothetical protein